MRRWFISTAITANALISGLVLLLVFNGDGWGEPTQLSSSESQLLVVVAVVALVLDLLLIPILGISFWARDRGFRRQEAELEMRRHEPPGDASVS